MSHGQDAGLWPLVEQATVAPGHIRLTLDPKALATAGACQADSLNPDLMHVDLPFQLRRRGVETRIVTGTPAAQPDPVLQKNLARAHGWLQQIKRGISMAALARKDGYSKSYIRNRVILAFLAPKIQRAILAGTLGPEWTTDRLLRADLPRDWSAQARLLGL
jgi:site-specific DNA recombinase